MPSRELGCYIQDRLERKDIPVEAALRRLRNDGNAPLDSNVASDAPEESAWAGRNEKLGDYWLRLKGSCTDSWSSNVEVVRPEFPSEVRRASLMVLERDPSLGVAMVVFESMIHEFLAEVRKALVEAGLPEASLKGFDKLHGQYDRNANFFTSVIPAIVTAAEHSGTFDRSHPETFSGLRGADIAAGILGAGRSGQFETVTPGHTFICPAKRQILELGAAKLPLIYQALRDAPMEPHRAELEAALRSCLQPIKRPAPPPTSSPRAP
jgi:hypothetical protein